MFWLVVVGKLLLNILIIIWIKYKKNNLIIKLNGLLKISWFIYN